MANTLEQATLVAFTELNTLFKTPVPKSGQRKYEKRVSELSTIINFLLTQISNKKQVSVEDLEADFWDRVV